MNPKEFDIVVYGASGFTGRLVAEYVLKTYGAAGPLRWAMAGRDKGKLRAIARELGAPESLATLEAEATDPASLDALTQRASVILTTVGPYQLYGEPLVAACARAGTDYVDLCGEPAWMAQMVERHESAAKASGARITFSCGFDSIPFDCGVFYLQQQAMERFGQPFSRVRGRVRKMKGGFSGGTLASMLATLEAGRRDPSIVKTMLNPYALVPASPGVRQPRGDSVAHDEGIGWSAPFIMAAINTKNVHRTNALTNYRYGRDFTYDEMQLMGSEQAAKAAFNAMRLQMALLAFAPTRALLRRFALPKPGQGPSKQEREAGSYEVLYVGDMGAGASDGRTLRAVVSGDKDPGYGSTSKMITEAALCLKDTPRTTTPGGIWTPAAAMGEALIARLQEKAGLIFKAEG